MAVDALCSPLGPPACEKDAKALQFIEEMTRSADAVQARVLAEIVSRNSETEYIRRYNLAGATDRETFKSKIPMVTYEDLEPIIQRIANGDRSPILSAHPISEFLTSSGTSAGERKLMPTIREELDRRQLLYSLLMPVMNLYMPGLDKGKGLYFLFVKSETKTPGGLLARPVLTSYYKSDHFKTRAFDPYNVYTSPNEAILCPDSFQSMYSQMLCGLYERQQVLRLGAIFASGLLRAIRFLQLNWRELAHDIRTGTLNLKISDSDIRSCMARVLRPDMELADFIESECSKDNWERIITRVWPNTKYLEVIVTGAMAQYIPTLDYYSGGLPKVCTMYASSECYFGLNLNPMCKPSEVSYTIMPNMAYFEFLPHDPNSPSAGSDKLVDLVDVEVGKEYELVITTYAGLCRYRVGDILRVTGFHNSAPQFHFVRRKNVLLSIDSDKTVQLLRFNQDCIFTPVSAQTQAFVPAHTVWRGVGNPPPMYGAYGQPLPPQTHAPGYGEPSRQQPYLPSPTGAPAASSASYSSAPPPASTQAYGYPPRQGSPQGPYPYDASRASTSPHAHGPTTPAAPSFYPTPPSNPAQPPPPRSDGTSPPPTSQAASRPSMRITDLVSDNGPIRSSTDSNMLNMLNRRPM